MQMAGLHVISAFASSFDFYLGSVPCLAGHALRLLNRELSRHDGLNFNACGVAVQLVGQLKQSGEGGRLRDKEQLRERDLPNANRRLPPRREGACYKASPLKLQAY